MRNPYKETTSCLTCIEKDKFEFRKKSLVSENTNLTISYLISAIQSLILD